MRTLAITNVFVYNCHEFFPMRQWIDLAYGWFSRNVQKWDAGSRRCCGHTNFHSMCSVVSDCCSSAVSFMIRPVLTTIACERIDRCSALTNKCESFFDRTTHLSKMPSSRTLVVYFCNDDYFLHAFHGYIPVARNCLRAAMTVKRFDSNFLSQEIARSLRVRAHTTARWSSSRIGVFLLIAEQ